MTAINFSRQFARPVRLGEKRRTIRRTKRCEKGGKLQFYTGMRTKSCRKLGDGICTGVTPVKIHENFLILEKKKITAAAVLKNFAVRDGHESWQSLTEWFEKRYGLPFSGWLHEWRIA